MFDFETTKLTTIEIMKIAGKQGVSPLKVAIKANGMRYAQSFWSDVNGVELDDECYTALRVMINLAVVGKGFASLKVAHDTLRRIKPFEGRKYFANQLKEEMLPSLEECDAVCVVDGRIYVNPRIIEWGEFERRFKVIRKKCAPWYEKYTKEEVEEAIELLRLMRKLNKALK